MRAHRRDAPLFNNCRQEEATHAAALPTFSTFVTFLGYYSARVRIKAERGKKSFPLFSCRFMLFHKHNLPICLKLPKRRSPGIVCRLSHTRSPKAPRRSPSQASVRRCLQFTRLVTYCEIRCQAVNQRSCRRRKLHPLIQADGGEGGGRRGGVIRLRVAGIHYVHAK